ncbi:MAG: endonuclease domain-containing protein [Clostridia bacterium]|nr:endonuclease domain-containing protein [Clostridia bacterium]
MKNEKEKAQKLRKHMTPEEKHLWYDFLKPLSVTVNRQKIIGHYIVDFYCARAKLIIELDGAHHFSKDGQEYDRIRDRFLTGLGLTVLRYPNAAVRNHFDEVCEEILCYINKAASVTELQE